MALLMACNGSSDDSDGPTASPGTSPTTTGPLTREQAQQLVGFPIFLPTALPANVKPTPQYSVGRPANGVDIRWFPDGPNTEPESPAFVYLHEQITGRLEPNSSPVIETIGGTDVQIVEVDPVRFPGFTASVTGVWRQGYIQLSVYIEWGDKTNLLELTDEMNAVARRVIESIVAQGSPSPTTVG
jgi:hypothetical protein